MYCVSCGSVIGDDFRFCEYCGMPSADYFEIGGVKTVENEPETNEPPEADVQREQPRVDPVCEKCGCPLKEDALFCEKCGAPVNPQKQGVGQTFRCEKCGWELETDSLFCDKCGAPVLQRQGSPAGWRCKQCGYELEEGFLFCDRCGARQID